MADDDQNRRNPALTAREASRVMTAIGVVLAGETDESWHDDMVSLCQNAQEKLRTIPRRGVMIAFSTAELAVVWNAIMNGAEGVLQPSSGFSTTQKKAFRDAANRIADAGNFRPKF